MVHRDREKTQSRGLPSCNAGHVENLEANLRMTGTQGATSPSFFQIAQGAGVFGRGESFPFGLPHQQAAGVFRIRANQIDFGKFIPIALQTRVAIPAPIFKNSTGPSNAWLNIPPRPSIHCRSKRVLPTLRRPNTTRSPPRRAAASSSLNSGVD